MGRSAVAAATSLIGAPSSVVTAVSCFQISISYVLAAKTGCLPPVLSAAGLFEGAGISTWATDEI